MKFLDFEEEIYIEKQDEIMQNFYLVVKGSLVYGNAAYYQESFFI